MDNELLIKAYEYSQKGRSYAFATVVESTEKGTPRKSGSKMIVLEDGTLFGTIGGGANENKAYHACLKAIKRKKPSLETYELTGKKGDPICGGKIRVFIEPFIKSNHLIICGGGHIALPLSVMMKMLNFKVTVVDNRKAFSNKKRFPHIDKTICQNPAKYLAKETIDNNTYIVVITHGHEFDFDCLKTIANSKAGYIGVISSMRKKTNFFKQLAKEGITKKSLNRIHIPIGLDIGAQTPEEIAVAISAEIISLTNKDLVGTKKFTK